MDTVEEILTILENFANAVPLMFASPVAFHVGKHSALVSPEVILRAEEENRELSDLVPKMLDVGGNCSWVVDLCRPPSEEDKKNVRATNRLSVQLKKVHTIKRNVGIRVPLPVRSQFDPDDIPVLGFLSGSAVVAEPAPIRHSDV